MSLTDSLKRAAQDVLAAITGVLAEFVGEAEQADDVTCVVVKRG